MTKNELQFINILKAIAIILVLITHNGFSLTFRENIFFTYFINMAVPLFILITGFNYSLSFSKINNINFVKILKSLFRKFKRLTIPFFIILLIEWYLNLSNIRFHHFTTAFINGGVGPGSYYYPVMVQFIILFPFIYLLLKKYKEKGVAIIFIIQFLADSIFYLTDINPNLHRVLCLRYIFLVSLGCYLGLKKEKINSNALLLMEMIGINFLTILLCSNSEQAYVPFTLWSGSSLLVSFYIFPIFAYIYYNYNIYSTNIFVKFISDIGRATWHIFLVQMIYFLVIQDYLTLPLKYTIPISLFVNITLGWIFYKVEKQVSFCIKNFLSKQ